MSYFRRLIVAVIVLAFISTAWYGAEMMIHGVSQRSAVDIFVAIMISISISGSVEKGVEENERKRQFAEKFTTDFIKFIKERKEAETGEDRNGESK